MSLRRGARSLSETAPRIAGSRLPRVIEPMTPQTVDEPFDSPAHIFEVIWDGLRAIVFVESNRVRVQDKYGRDVTHRFPELQAIADRVHGSGLAFDGEIVALDGNHRPDFSRLAPRLARDDAGAIAEIANRAPATFEAFDLLYREGQPVTGWTLRRRKEMLRSLIRTSPAIAVPDWVTRDGIAFFDAAREHELEGIVAKELDSRYLQGQRSPAWLTVKVHQRDEFVIAGYTFGGRWDARRGNRPAREPLHSLLLGAYDADEQLRFVGEITGGFDKDSASDLVQMLDTVSVTDSPFAETPALNRLVFWCRPEICATVRFGGWSAEDALRFPVFEAARPDVPAVSCRLPEDA
jgi:bifunctional non-homologous end joining protein LigD